MLLKLFLRVLIEYNLEKIERSFSMKIAVADTGYVGFINFSNTTIYNSRFDMTKLTYKF